MKAGLEGKVVLLISPLCVVKIKHFLKEPKETKKLLQFQHVNHEVITYYC